MTKQKIAIYVEDELIKQIDASYADDNCSSRSEFFNKAAKFYLGYIASEKNINYALPLIDRSIGSHIRKTESEICAFLFKLAVSVEELAYITAGSNQYTDEEWQWLKQQSIDAVSRANGQVSFDGEEDYA